MKTLIKNLEQFVNESWDISDNYEPGVYSNCCGAAVIHGGVCTECGEYCDVEDEYEYEEFPEDQVNDPEFESDYDHELYEKKSRKETRKDAKEKYPNLKPRSIKKGLEKMKGKELRGA